MTYIQYIPQYCRKEKCLSTTQQQNPSTIQHWHIPKESHHTPSLSSRENSVFKTQGTTETDSCRVVRYSSSKMVKVNCFRLHHEGVMRSRVTAPLILNPDHRWRYVVSLTLWSLSHRRETPAAPN
jgi:hypothetical protein